MGDGQPAAGIGLDQREGRARHFQRGIVGERADEGAGEGGLAGAEPAGERHDVARREAGGDVLGEGGGRRLVGQVDGRRIVVGHRFTPAESSYSAAAASSAGRTGRRT